jgi:sialate O-acetylesterase
MVLQRGRPNTFWGWTTPGSSVAVSVDGRKASGVAGPDGKWSVRIVPPRVGGPYTVAIDGSQHVELSDVLVGDVWLCTGQSNMEFGLTLENGGAEEVAAANDPNLRLFIAPHQTTLEPMKVNGGTWKVCTPETVAQEGWGGFSAVGYHFGKALRREVGVPIGLVEVVWGGTNAESWASREGLRPLGDFDAAFQQIDAAKNVKAEDDQGEALGWQKPEFDASGWKSVRVPDGFSGLGLDNFDGTAWFRKEVTLTEDQAAGTATISLGAIDDNDTTWINGVQVGAIQSYNTPRNYSIPAGTLHAGRNVITVRVVDTGAFGGFSGPADVLTLTLRDGSKLPLAGDWLGKQGAGLPLNGPNVPTSLSNGMIEPEVPLAIKGAIWYQGENNAGRAYQYRRILPTMIADWRRRFGQGDFPFYIVSLASYMPQRSTPGDDEWAELREAQAMTARNVRNSGLALAIDVGDAADIHPKEKETVGERLARIALAKDYGKRIEYSGPTFKSLTIQGHEAVVKFDHADGLVTRGALPGEFSVAGPDRQWHWAMARIEGDTVVVSSPNVPKPVAVRYAWQSNPTANLYNKAGLPAVPFRTDDWPGRTFGRK